MCGEDIWWHRDQNFDEIIFHDGDDRPHLREEGPLLLSFEEYNLQNVSEILEQRWEQCLNENVTLPINDIKIYNDDGDYGGSRKMLAESKVGDTGLEMISGVDEVEVQLIDVSSKFDTVNIFEDDDSMVLDNGKDVNNNSNLPVHRVPKKSIYTFNLKSGLAKSICKVIGVSAELREFDKNHISFKNFKYETSRKFCQNLLPQLQERVIKQYKVATSFMDEWQKDYYVEHGVEPGSEQLENNEECFKMYMQVVHGRKLLQMWKFQDI